MEQADLRSPAAYPMQSQGKINGLLIDCSRLLEKKSYYTRLIDFMADWGMNVLILHFSDDHGCSVRLPGFAKLAAPHAFAAREISMLTRHAKSKGIDLIPELACFGHTRYLTNLPDYEHLFAGRKTGKLKLNALDVFNPETTALVKRLIDSVCSLFPSKYIHLGCDEVNIKSCCNRGNDNEAEVWSSYVNTIASFARANGKTPMIWADHVVNSHKIRRLLTRNTVLIEWQYARRIKTSAVDKLAAARFSQVLLAPSIACSLHRFAPTVSALKNTDAMLKLARTSGAMGVINTAWCPWRYLQNALYYGIAYSAFAANHSGSINLHGFHCAFASRVFRSHLTSGLERFLSLWPTMEIDHNIASKLFKSELIDSRLEKKKLSRINRVGQELLLFADSFVPEQNQDIWRGMVLALKCAWLCSEKYSIAQSSRTDSERRKAFRSLLRQTQQELSEDWDRTRYPDDPQKYKARFANSDQEHQYALVLMKRLGGEARQVG